MKCNTGSCVQNILPETAKYFKEELVAEILAIPPQKPNIERVLDIIVWPEIEDINLIETPVGMSNEGQYLSGLKLIVEVRLKEKVTYVADEPTQSVHAAHYETLKSMFVILPTEIDGRDTADLVRSGRISVVPYIEAVDFRGLDCRNIYKCVLLFLNVKIC